MPDIASDADDFCSSSSSRRITTTRATSSSGGSRRCRPIRSPACSASPRNAWKIRSLARTWTSRSSPSTRPTPASGRTTSSARSRTTAASAWSASSACSRISTRGCWTAPARCGRRGCRCASADSMFPAASRCCRSGLNRSTTRSISAFRSMRARPKDGSTRFCATPRRASSSRSTTISTIFRGSKGRRSPYMPPERVGRTLGMISSFDAGRGCPFLCSFCTIINVQGRKSRYRTADDIEALVRINVANGVRYFFITDDNLARNRNWESIFDRLDRAAEGRHPLALHHPGRHGVPQDFPLHREGGGGGRQAGVHRA